MNFEVWREIIDGIDGICFGIWRNVQMDREVEFLLGSTIRCFLLQTMTCEALGLAEGTLWCSSINVRS